MRRRAFRMRWGVVVAVTAMANVRQQASKVTPSLGS
jgi:hypothetical protein